MYQAAIRAVMAKPMKFKDGMKCAICKKEHMFNKCPILLDILYLRKHFIAYCLLMNRTQWQMNLAVNQITARMADVDTNDGDDTGPDSDSSNSDTIDDSQDFRQEEV